MATTQGANDTTDPSLHFTVDDTASGSQQPAPPSVTSAVTLKWPTIPFPTIPFAIPETILPKVDEALSALDPYVPGLIKERFRRNSGLFIGCPISRLLNVPDIWVDHIFPYFTVEDIISFRQVCKDYNILTHEPIIWRRFLKRMNYPLPPLRGTWRYTQRLNDFEVEQLVTQAISVDNNWRSDTTKLYSQNNIFVGLLTNDLFVLPGGRWMIASQMDRGKPTPPLRVRCYLTLYMLDHPYGPTAVAQIETWTRAYNIRAKICKLRRGEDGMVIYYNRRKPRLAQPRRFYDEDLSHDFDHNIDIPGGYDYNMAVIYCNLNMLEWLKQPDIDHKHPNYKAYLRQVPDPFKELCMFNSPYQFTQTDIVQYVGKTWLVAINLPHEMHFFNILDQKEHIVIVIQPHHEHRSAAYRIRAFRIYPDSDSMILIRSCKPAPTTQEIHFVEWVDLPTMGGIIQVSAKTRYIFKPQHEVRNFTISDHGWYNRLVRYGDHPDTKATAGPPPPISIYIEFEKPRGVQHHAIFAEQEWEVNAQFPEGHWRYFFRHTSYSMSIHMSEPDRAKVLPGSQRAVICYIDGSDRTATPRLLRLKRYNPPVWQGHEYLPDDDVEPDEDPDDPVTRLGKRAPLSRTPFKEILGSDKLAEELNALGGLRAIAWDESTGRIVVAADKDHYIRIVGTARCEVPSGRTEEWKMRRKWIGREIALANEREMLHDPNRYMCPGPGPMQVDG